jgi:hypothetical protein
MQVFTVKQFTSSVLNVAPQDKKNKFAIATTAANMIPRDKTLSQARSS